MAKQNLIGPGAHKKELTRLIRANVGRFRLHEVFSDFCELGALSISNAVDKLQFDVREARYLQIVGRYERDEVARFPQMLAVLVMWLECGYADCMGDLFMSLELGDHWKGQFFTPYPVAALMARLTLGDASNAVKAQGFVTLSEPACGAGAMVIAYADAMNEQGINYQRAMHATAVDLDSTAVHMTYLQLSLLGVPALVVRGNSLSLQEWEHWATPAHVLGGWDHRLRTRRADRSADEAVAVPIALDVDLEEHGSETCAAARVAVVAHRLDQMSLFG